MFKKSLFILLALSCAQPSLVQAGIWNKIQPTSAAVSTKEDGFDVESFPTWSDLTPEKAVAVQKEAIKKAKAEIDRIGQLSEKEMNFDSVYREYDRIMGEYANDTTYLSFIHLVQALDGWEDGCNEIAELDQEFIIWLGKNQKLRDAFLTVGEEKMDKDFDHYDSYFVFNTLLDLAESGIDLEGKDKIRLNELLTELSEAEAEYSANMSDSSFDNYFLVENNEKHLLAGIPDSMIDEAKVLAREEKYGTFAKPAWMFNASYAIIGCAENAEMRERAWRYWDDSAVSDPYDNAPSLDNILSLRDELAKLLEYPSFADLEANKTMIAGTENAVDLVDVIQEVAMPPYKQYMDELLAYINKKTGQKSTRINPWDIYYYAAVRDYEEHDFDEYEFCQYYPYEHVRDYCFKYFGDLFGLRIEEVPSQYVAVGSGKALKKGTVAVWAPQVQVYKVYDQETGKYVGAFYLDAFIRDEKYEGAWAFNIKSSPKLEALVVDITPTAEDEPNVLAGVEIHSLVHEFGHVLHFLMSDTELTSQSSDKSAQDFIETPSQLLEQWVLDRNFLKGLSKHVETGKSIPDKLLDSYIASRDNFRIVEDINHLQEVKLDLEMHLNYASKFKGKNLNIASRGVLKDCSVKMSTLSNSPAYRMSSSITGGYSAKYYSYLWSHILVSDIFSVFQKKGLSNKKVGRELRDKVLSKGASIHPTYLIEDFLGLEIEPAPYFKKQGYID